MAIVVLDASTEWVETNDGKRLKWTCPECEIHEYKERRHATISCSECDAILQAEDYSVDPNNPDPENPDWHLKKLARRRGLPADEYMEEAEPHSALSW